jgi:hypothetical protein
MTKQKQAPGPPMTLGNMRALGVQRIIASCLNDACRHVAVRPNWKEHPPRESLTGNQLR